MKNKSKINNLNITRNIYIAEYNSVLPVALTANSTYLILDMYRDKYGLDPIPDFADLGSFLSKNFVVNDDNLIINDNGAVVDAYNINKLKKSPNELLSQYKEINPEGEYLIKEGRFPIFIKGAEYYNNELQNRREIEYSTHIVYLKNYKDLLKKEKNKCLKKIKKLFFR